MTLLAADAGPASFTSAFHQVKRLRKHATTLLSFHRMTTIGRLYIIPAITREQGSLVNDQSLLALLMSYHQGRPSQALNCWIASYTSSRWDPASSCESFSRHSTRLLRAALKALGGMPAQSASSSRMD